MNMSSYTPSIVKDLVNLESRLQKQEARRASLMALKPEGGESPATAEERTVPVDHEMFENPNDRTQEVSWKNSLFGSVTIGLKGLCCGEKEQRDPYTMVVPIRFDGKRPDSVSFSVKCEHQPGIRIYRSQMSPITDVTEGFQPDAVFSITWKEIGRGVTAPQTIKGKRDMDLVFLDVGGVVDHRSGAFLILEVGIATRGTTLYLCFQSKVYAGQVVSTTVANAEVFGLTTVKVDDRLMSVVPLMPHCAAPGTDFFKNFGHLAESLVCAAVQDQSFTQLHRCVVPKWEPVKLSLPENLVDDGWTGANTGWFNNFTGYGFLVDDSGNSVFAHFYNIEDQNGNPAWKREFPVLAPYARLAIKPSEDRQGNPITRIRVL